MWRFLLVVVAVDIVKNTTCLETAPNPNPRPTRQLDFGDERECCPCSSRNTPPSIKGASQDPATEIPEDSPESDAVIEPETAMTEGLDSTKTCRCNPNNDLTPQGSEVVHTISRGLDDCLRLMPPPPEPKPLFRPEVGFASSVLETLKAANEEELQEARSRAAAKPSETLRATLSKSKGLPIKGNSGRKAIITVRKLPTLGKPNAITGPSFTSKGFQTKLGSAKMGDSDVGSSVVSSQIIPARSTSTQIRSPLIPHLGSRLLGSPKITKVPLGRYTLRDQTTGKILTSAPTRNINLKAPSNALMNTLKTRIDSGSKDKHASPLEVKLTALPKKEAPKILKPSLLKAALNKAKVDIALKKDVSKVTKTKALNKISKMRDTNDMENAASDVASTNVIGSAAKLKLNKEALKKGKLEIKGGNDIKKVLLLGNILQSRANKPAGAKNFLESERKTPMTDNFFKTSEFNPLKIGGKLLASIDKIRSRILTALSGKSSWEDQFDDSTSGSSLAVKGGDSKLMEDMSSSPSNIESVAEKGNLPLKSTGLAKDLVVQPYDVIDRAEEPKASITAPGITTKRPKLASTLKKIPVNGNIDSSKRQSMIQSKAAKSSDVEVVPSDTLGETKKKIASSNIPDNLKSPGDVECCNNKLSSEPLTMNQEKVFNCKLVCNASKL